MTTRAPLHDQGPLLPVNHRADRPLRIVLTIMAFLAGLALLGSRMADRSFERWQGELSGFATVQVIPGTIEARGEAITATEAALASFDIIRVSDSEARALLRPWIGDAPLPSGIALPLLWRVNGAETAALSTAVDALPFSAQIEDSGRWARDIAAAQTRLSSLSFLIVCLMIGASLATTIFATQSAISAERETVSVFTQVGASDKFIASLFVRRAVRIGGVAACIGLGLAAVLGFILSIIGGFNSALFLPKLSLHISDIAVIIMLAIALTALGALAAGVAVRRILISKRRQA